MSELLTLIRPEIRQLSAYHVADAAGMIKLDAMENPYVWDEGLRAAWLEHLKTVNLNRYPHPHAPAVKAGLRAVMDIPPEMEVMLGNGSDEILQILLMALALPGATVLAVEPCFVMYRFIAKFAGMEYVGVPLNEDFSLHREAILAAIAVHRPAVIFLAEPNNPTGNKYDRETVCAIIEAAPGFVVMDEAYLPFTDGDAMDLLRQYPNVLVMRTLSKVGLAGLRLGLLVGRPDVLGELEKIRLPYNINILSQASAEFALAHYSVFEAQAKHIRAERSRLFEGLSRQPSWTVYPSEANFLLARVPAGRARAIFEGLKAKGILIKILDGAHPLLADCLRFTVGLPEENDAVLAALQGLR
ncbi:histidinol-phosphate aminotransferase [Fluviicoccus keumensis]|uniref:Histidinol-phosphate aminotransferase n=1 Tax=Fluviicoccus keumensis TaxID=1435465 RepID=A0A4Q7YG71_9GAMM|nr:histidinol-phosphate transaminase [Fluviicoccus keumensis]RZU35345.1 histidinol-phosphate aminotransferase [Fluviicoccus keumensis]